MAFTLTMPKLSPTMEEGTIAKWHKKEGDMVKEGDVLFEVSTDKATVEHNAIDAGYLRKILIGEGDTAIVNQSVAVFTEDANENIESYEPEGVKPEEVAVVAEKTTSEEPKEAVSKPAASGGALQQPAFTPEPPLKDYSFPYSDKLQTTRIFASPLARKLAEEKGIDLSTVKGSGPNQRILKRDLDLGQPDQIVTFGRRTVPNIVPGSYEEEKLKPMRKVISQRLQESKSFIPHFYVTQEVRADSLVRVREELKAMGIKVSYNDFVVRAVALTLREHPKMNSGFNTVNNSIVHFKTIDISIAVSMEEGLITPIVRHADFKSIGEISAEVKSLATRARDGKLSREEYAGGSFTISNLGMVGVSSFSAIINPPQAGIIAVGGIEEKAVVDNGTLTVGKTMTLTLSADHRVVDGLDGGLFIKRVQEFLENPSTLLLT